MIRCSKCIEDATQICRYCEYTFCDEHAELHKKEYEGDETVKPAEMEKLDE